MAEPQGVRDPDDRAGDRVEEDVEPGLVDEVVTVVPGLRIQDGVSFIDDEDLVLRVKRASNELEGEASIDGSAFGKGLPPLFLRSHYLMRGITRCQ